MIQFQYIQKNTLVCTLFQWITITNALPNTVQNTGCPNEHIIVQTGGIDFEG